MADGQNSGGEQPGAPNPGASLQFDKAEIPATPAAASAGPAVAACAVCSAPLTFTYWDVNGRAACPTCKASIEAQLVAPVSSDVYLRSLALGVAAALLSSLAWFLVMWKIGQFGILAIVVGVFVGRAVLKGARGRGGVEFQIMAVALTYLSISGAYLTYIIVELGSVATGVLGRAIEFALMAPFKGSIIGIIIVGIALFYAWVANRRAPVSIQGPYRAASAPPEAAAPDSSIAP